MFKFGLEKEKNYFDTEEKMWTKLSRNKIILIQEET